jgi:uncharacterized protein
MTGDMNAGNVDAALAPHLPHAAPIDAYGSGGFRFAGMSHRGSLLCLPTGIWASPLTSAGEIDEAALTLALEPATPDAAVDHFLIGTGKNLIPVAPTLREAFRKRRIVVESMSTGAAVRTYNILLGERRRVGAVLVAVD